MSGRKRQIYHFDDFRLDTGERRLLRDGQPVNLSSKAFDLLALLVENNGRLLGKEEIYERVWRDQIVEESNLTVQMSAIRKALGENRRNPHYIGTIIGSGYRFTANVQPVENRPDAEMIIESEFMDRFVIETEEIEVSNGATGSSAASMGGSIGSTLSRSEQLLIRTGVGRRVLISAGLIVLLLMAGFCGYWLFREHPQAAALVSEPRQQMTITRLTDGRQFGAASISPDGKFVAYIENSAAGVGSVFVQQIDTNTVRQVLDPAERTFGCVNFSPDSTLIYYIVFDKRDPHGALYSVPVLGDTPKRILGDLGSCFTLSPDGTRVAFYRGDRENDRTDLVVSSVDGTQQAIIDRDRGVLSSGLGLAWSPDGNLIAISGTSEPHKLRSTSTLFAVETASGTVRPLTTERFYSVGKMVWTRDGRSLIFVGKRSESEQELYLMEYPSGAVRQITNDLETYGNYGMGVTSDSGALVADIFERKIEIWSVETRRDAGRAVRVTSGTTNGRFGIAPLPGDWVAYITRTNKGLEIRATNKDGSESKTLTNDSFTQKHVVASPDGRYLVFSSDQAGGRHIFRINADDGSEVTQLTFGSSSDGQPDISPDGNWVTYVSLNGKRSTIWKVPISGGTPVQLTDYESGSPVFSPDGKTIACELRADGRTVPELIALISAEGGPPLKSFPVLPFVHDYQTIRWSPDGDSVVFIKGENGVLNLWWQPVLGGPPKQLTNFSEGVIWNFAFSRNGNRIFIARGTTFVDIVLIRNFV